MVAPNFGLQFIRQDDQPTPVLGSNLDVVGLIGPCNTADPDTFPLNTPVLVFSNDTATLARLGDDGYLVDAINGINSQLADLQSAAQLVIVVTPYGTASDANLKMQQTIAHIMGDSVSGHGVWAFKKAPSTLYCTPRLILAPGYTGQMANSLDTLNIGTVGIGYIPGQEYQVQFAAGGGETNGANLVMPVAHAVADVNGTIDENEIFIDSFGAWMTVAPTATLPLPDGPPVSAQNASGQIIFSRTPGIGATITLNGTVVSFVAPGTSGALTSGSNLTGGATGVAASGWIAFGNQPAVNDTITINGTVVTFVAGTPTGNQVQIGGNLAATMTNLENFLTNSADTGLAASTYSLSGNTITITAKATGTGGNSIGISTNVALSGNRVRIADDGDLLTTMTNLVTFLNGSADAQISQNTYSLIGSTLQIVQDGAGAAGNAYTVTTTVTGASTSGPTLAGGRDSAASTQATLVVAISLGANPVCAALSGGVLNGLMGHAVVESSGVSLIDDENWRTTLNSQRLIPCSGGVKIQDPVSGDIIVMPFAPRVVGAIIARDFETGYPFHSAANSAISGIVGPARTIDFSLTDAATEGQQLLAANLGILVRGEVGIETAISSGGFVYVGTDNAGDDPEWQFYNVTRGRDFIELSLMPALRVYLGRTNIDRQTITNVVATIQDWLNTLTNKQQILGGVANFRGSLNSASEIRLGHITVSFQAEEPSPLKLITTMSARYRPAIDALISSLEQQLNLAA